MSGSVSVVNGSLIRKWLGINAAKSFGFEKSGLRGLGLKMASISTRTVSNISWLNVAGSTVFRSNVLAFFAAVS